ncbi:hypothetical protein AB0L25_39165 [Spirillospora sp. NPDC052242]
MSERRSGGRRLVRAGTASAAVSAGALALLFTAPAAHAAAAPEVCKEGTDPASTIENWKCRLGNIRESLAPGTPSPSPTPPPSSSAPAKPSEPSEEPEEPAPEPEPERSEAAGGGAGGAPPPVLEAPVGDAPPAADVEVPAPEPAGGVLPAPEIAPEPVAAARPQTRLVAPVAATGEQTDRAVWVAAAAASAGAVAAVHLSVAGRVLRARHAAAPARGRTRR